MLQITHQSWAFPLMTFSTLSNALNLRNTSKRDLLLMLGMLIHNFTFSDVRIDRNGGSLITDFVHPWKLARNQFLSLSIPSNRNPSICFKDTSPSWLAFHPTSHLYFPEYSSHSDLLYILLNCLFSTSLPSPLHCLIFLRIEGFLKALWFTARAPALKTRSDTN